MLNLLNIQELWADMVKKCYKSYYSVFLVEFCLVSWSFKDSIKEVL